MAEGGKDGACSAGDEQLEECCEARNSSGSRSPDPVQQVAGDDPSGNGIIADPVLPCNREKCRYGEQCYRKNAGHKRQFSHPGDPDYYDVTTDKTECPYGSRCYRKNPLHRMRYKHTQASTADRYVPDTDESSDAEESVDESEYEPESDDLDGTTEEEHADSEESSDENV